MHHETPLNWWFSRVKVVMVPFNADNVGVFDPATGAFASHDISGTISRDWKYYAGVLAPDGKVLFHLPGR